MPPAASASPSVAYAMAACQIMHGLFGLGKGSDLPAAPPSTPSTRLQVRTVWPGGGQRAAAGLLQLAALAGPLHKLALVGGTGSIELDRERDNGRGGGVALADAIFVQRQRQLNNFYACLHISTMHRTDAKFERKLNSLRCVQRVSVFVCVCGCVCVCARCIDAGIWGQSIDKEIASVRAKCGYSLIIQSTLQLPSIATES